MKPKIQQSRISLPTPWLLIIEIVSVSLWPVAPGSPAAESLPHWFSAAALRCVPHSGRSGDGQGPHRLVSKTTPKDMTVYYIHLDGRSLNSISCTVHSSNLQFTLLPFRSLKWSPLYEHHLSLPFNTLIWTRHHSDPTQSLQTLLSYCDFKSYLPSSRWPGR